MSNSYKYCKEFGTVVSLDLQGRERGRLQVPPEDLFKLAEVLNREFIRQALTNKDFLRIIQELKQKGTE